MPSLRMLYWYCTITDMGKKALTPFTKLAQLVPRKKAKKILASIEQPKQETAPTPTLQAKNRKTKKNAKMAPKASAKTKSKSQHSKWKANKRH